MTSRHGRRLATGLRLICLLCLFLLTLAPASSGQQPAAADVSALVSELKDKEAKVRAEAVRRLTGLGEAAKPAAPALVEALGDSDAKVRYRAVIALGNLWSGGGSGPEIEKAVPALVRLLKDKDEYTRRRAMYALRMIGPAARAALPALNKIMRDRDDPLWVYAYNAVRDIERPATDDVSALAGLLKDKDAKVRIQAAERLYSTSMKTLLLTGSYRADAAIPALIEALKDPEIRVRYHALTTLGNLMFEAQPPDLGAAIPTLIELLKDADSSDTRWQAANVLGKIGPRSRDAVPLLTQALSDKDHYVRSSAANALGEIGPESRVAAPSLIKLLKDPVADVRASAATALAKVEPGSAGVVVASLSEDLKEPVFKGWAARALGHFGPEAKPATLLLADMLKTEDYLGRHQVVKTLAKIGPGGREAVPALRSILNDRVPYIRVAAAVALLKIAPESETEIPPELLKEAKAKIEKDEETERAGGHTTSPVYIPKPGTEWDEAKDLLSRGAQFYERGNFDAAVASITEALKIDPQYAAAYHSRGVIHRRRGDYAAAVADYTKAIESDRESTERHYLARGSTHIDRRDYDAAVADFTAIIKLNAYNADAYYGRGLAHHYRGSLDAAVADYDRAIEIVPPETKAFGGRGAAKLAQGKVADAIADLNQAVKVDPKNAVNYEGLGDAYARTGDTGQARDTWNKALSLSPDAESKSRLKGKLSGAAKQ